MTRQAGDFAYARVVDALSGKESICPAILLSQHGATWRIRASGVDIDRFVGEERLVDRWIVVAYRPSDGDDRDGYSSSSFASASELSDEEAAAMTGSLLSDPIKPAWEIQASRNGGPLQDITEAPIFSAARAEADRIEAKRRALDAMSRSIKLRSEELAILDALQAAGSPIARWAAQSAVDRRRLRRNVIAADCGIAILERLELITVQRHAHFQSDDLISLAPVSKVNP